MHILISGAFGTIGMHATKRLLKKGHRVSLLDLSSSKNRKRARQFKRDAAIYWGDVRDEHVLLNALRGVDAVVHCAAVLFPVSEQRPELSAEVNIGGTTALLRACEQMSPAPVFIYPSSVGVYGTLYNDHLCSVDDNLEGTDCYTRHKIECETIVKASPLRWMILRLGVSLEASFTQTSDAALRAMFRINPKNRMELVHPNDVARVICSAVGRSDIWNRVFNIGGGPTCQTTYQRLFDSWFGAAGVGKLPDEAFGRLAYYTPWMDTTVSQRVFDYQRSSFDDFNLELRSSLARLRPLVTMLRPLIRRRLLLRSEPWLCFREGKGQ